jgi:hypothetical protein
MPHGKIDLAIKKVDVLWVCADAEFQIRVLARECPQPRNQPFGGEAGRDTDGQDASLALRINERALSQPQPAKRFGGKREIKATGFSQR